MPSQAEFVVESQEHLAGALDLIRGSGEMAELIRAHAWADTEFGPISQWPPELLSVVNHVLASREIMTVFWGPRRCMIYNDQYAKQLGARHPMLGRPLREVWPDVAQQVAPLIDPAFEEGRASYLDNAPLTVVEDGHETHRFYTASFEPIWVRRGSSMAVEGVFQSAINNTAAIHAEEQLRAAEARERDLRLVAQSNAEQLALAVEAGGLAIWYYDPDEGVVGGDRKMAQLFGLAEPKGPAGMWIAKIHPDDQARVAAEFEAALAGEHYDTEYRVLRGQSVCWVRAKAKQVSAGSKRLSGTCMDVTKQKLAEMTLLQNEKLIAVGRLASTIAHEVNNPLESVTNLLYLIRTSELLQDVRDYADTAELELRRVSLIANQTLQFHKQSTNAAPAFCYDLIGDSLAIYQSRVANNHVTVEKRKRAEHPVECFGGEIRQVLNNLIGNALDAMPRGGRLLLRSREATDHRSGRRGLVITVADTGAGMSTETKQRLFDAFYTTKGIGGTGLGLWISKNIAERHHGYLSFRSCAAGEKTGTVFNIFLPYAS